MQPDTPPVKPSYDFILNEGQKPKRGFGSSLKGLPKPALFIVAAMVLIVVIVILGTLLGSKSGKGADSLTTVLGSAQEINRVNTLEGPLLKDPNTLNLLTTAQIALTSEQTQIKKVLSSQKIKVDTKKLAGFENKNTDSLLQSAAQNNNLDGAYRTYLKSALTDYESSLQSAYSSTSSAALKAVLQSAYKSTQTLLASPQLSSGS